MSESPAQIGARFYAPLIGDGADLAQTIRDDARCEEAAALIKPEAAIRFITPDGGRVGGLANDFSGIEGFRAGWREWLKPFDEFHVIPEVTLGAGPGRALFLARTIARPQGSQAMIDQAVGVLVTVEDDLVAAIDQYLDQDQAKRAAGLAG
jgi:hypothetical protein